MDDPVQEADLELEAQLILLAASNHNIEALRTLLRTGSANIQDPDTGYTPLHSAIAACENSPPSSPIKENGHSIAVGLPNGNCIDEEAKKIDGPADDLMEVQLSNGHGEKDNPAGSDSEVHVSEEIEAAEKTIRLLFQNGAIWNDLDKNNETPGCLARRLGLDSLYDLIVDAGVRAEMLLNRLDGYEMLRDEDSEEEEEESDVHDPEASTVEAEQEPSADGVTDVPAGQPEPSHQGHIAQPGTEEITSEGYLNSDLTFGRDRILDQDNNGVMMAWESEIMQRTADLLAPATGLRVLNIGHGMGIIDDFFQTKAPAIHHIIEAHPTVLAEMKKNGWDQKPGVAIHEGKWQDVVPKLIEEGTLFDAIYFDTFAEEYKALHQFFEENVIGLLDDGGKWGFFNGLGADRQVCYDVYSKVVEIDLLEAGYDVEWETLKVQDLDREKQWEGVKRPYWQLENYKLPVCTFIG
ncbi:Arginine N-methyltransferase 2 [Trapelia coarctata]|nr:Arginine N-methyltransferase 2 [Trapelia coarctata]